MADEKIACPHCQAENQIPESALGEDVTCPKCSAVFTAPLRQGDGSLGEPALRQAPANPDYTREMALRQMRWPGLVLVLIGLLGSLANGRLVWMFEFEPEALKEQVKQFEGLIYPKQEQQQEGKQGEPKKGEPEQPPIEEVNPSDLKPAAYIFLGCSILSLLGGLSALTLRVYWLSFLGSIAAGINFGGCCCLMGAPAGLWCIANLIDVDVKQHYR